MAIEVSKSYLQALTNAINQVTGASKLVAQAKLMQLIQTGKYEKPLDLVEDALDELEPLFQQLTETTASLSAQAYDIIRLAELGEDFGAQPYPDHRKEWTRKAFEGMAAKSKNMNSFLQQILDRLDYEAKRAAGTTQFANGEDDTRGKPMFARVPMGRETCQFCLMLASRGFVYRSAKVAGQLDHYHPHCDCRVVASFDENSKIAGYDPDEYYAQYQAMVNEGTLNVQALERSASKAHKRHRS